MLKSQSLTWRTTAWFSQFHRFSLPDLFTPLNTIAPKYDTSRFLSSKIIIDLNKRSETTVTLGTKESLLLLWWFEHVISARSDQGQSKSPTNKVCYGFLLIHTDNNTYNKNVHYPWSFSYSILFSNGSLSSEIFYVSTEKCSLL